MRVGLLLPHFGRHADPSRLLDGITEIERLGYDSIWVRDHIVYRPHAFEDQDASWLDPFVVLSAAAARSERLILGTATLIPHRHPIHAAQLLSSLAFYVGAERVITGWGSGNDPDEFRAIGAPVERRGAQLEEQLEIMRRLWDGEPVTHEGEFYRFENVQLRPKPRGGPIRQWYGGGSPRAMERAAAHFDGLLASRMPRFVLRDRIEYLRALRREQGLPEPEIGYVTIVAPGRTVEEALAKVDVARIRADTTRRFPDGRFETVDDLDGTLVVGPPDRLAEELAAFEAIGVHHFIVDLRACFEEWEELVPHLAEAVLPLVRTI